MFDPQAELNATLNAFFTSTQTADASPLCQFPSRRRWLDEKMNIQGSLEVPACQRYENWVAKLNPTAVSLVFASYYFNNPASMYGHTFLKLNRQGYEEGKGLLDYTVNYAAEANTKNGITFAWKGLVGGYKGRFSTDPYYVKILKYNNIESRDLWEYQLNLSSAEINSLLEHLWELGPVSVTYFFFNKNCSYQLLPILDVLRPGLDLSSEFRYRAIPLDTLEAVLRQPGLVTGWTMRPSHVRSMLARRDLLSSEEAKLAKSLGSQLSPVSLNNLKNIPEARQAMVLDSAYDYARYKSGFYRDRSLEAQEKEQRLLKLRRDVSAADSHPPPLRFDEVPPQSGHPTARAAVSLGVTKDEPFQEISLRGSLHDQESDPTGYVPGSELEMGHLRGRYYSQRGKFSLEQLTMVNIFSLVPADPWIHPPSSRLWLRFDTAHDLDKDPENSLDFGTKGGSGFSFHVPGQPGAIWYAMWRGEFVIGGTFDQNYRLGLGGETGLVLPIRKRLRFHLSANALRFPMGEVGNVVRYYGAGTYTLARNWEVRLIGERQNSYQEARLGLNYYW